MTRIDSHHHFWDLSVRDQPWTAELPALRRSFSMADLVPELDRSGIDATVLVQTVTVAAETPELLAIASASARIAGVVGWLDLEAPDVTDTLAGLRGLPGGERLVGIRHQVQGEPDPGWLDRPSVRRGLAAVAAAGLTYDLLVKPDQLPAAISAARDTPGLRFVLDHGGKPQIARHQLEPWGGLIASLGALPNVAVKLSGLATEASNEWTVRELQPYVDTILEAFGASRILFGSDWPVSLLAASYSETIGAAEQLLNGVSADERDAVFGSNALTWYRLSLERLRQDEGSGRQ
jgi:L-fuconolactonase